MNVLYSCKFKQLKIRLKIDKYKQEPVKFFNPEIIPDEDL
jgi:hypothetical protein